MPRDLEPPPSSLPLDMMPTSRPGQVSIGVGPELAALRTHITRLQCPGFEPPPRLIFAVEPDCLQAIASSVLLIAEVRPMLKASCPRAPRAVGLLWLGEAVSVEIIGLPADPAFAPAWPMALAGASAVIDLCDAGKPLVRAFCEVAELKLYEPSALLDDPFEIGSAGLVAALLRSAFSVLAAGAS